MPPASPAFELSVSLGEATFAASGNAELVMKAWAEFKALVAASDMKRPISRSEPPLAKHEGVASGTTGSRSRGATAAEVPLPAFLKRLKLPANKYVAAAILSWSARHGDQDTLTSAEIDTLWKSTHHKLPSSTANLVRDLRGAVKEGWVKVQGSGHNLTFSATGFTHSTVDGWMAGEKG